jgi:hypothetical protein
VWIGATTTAPGHDGPIKILYNAYPADNFGRHGDRAADGAGGKIVDENWPCSLSATVLAIVWTKSAKSTSMVRTKRGSILQRHRVHLTRVIAGGPHYGMDAAADSNPARSWCETTPSGFCTVSSTEKTRCTERHKSSLSNGGGGGGGTHTRSFLNRCHWYNNDQTAHFESNRSWRGTT